MERGCLVQDPQGHLCFLQMLWFFDFQSEKEKFTTRYKAAGTRVSLGLMAIRTAEIDSRCQSCMMKILSFCLQIQICLNV